MDRKTVLTALFLDALDCWSIESVTDRLLTQYKFYIARFFELNLHYKFVWYISIPYSSDLAYTTFNILQYNQKEDFKNYKLKPYVLERLKLVNNLKNILEFQDMQDAVFYRFAAIAVYLLDNDLSIDILRKKNNDNVIMKNLNNIELIGKKLMEIKSNLQSVSTNYNLDNTTQPT